MIETYCCVGSGSESATFEKMSYVVDVVRQAMQLIYERIWP